jgi:hypothetical protein
MHAVVGDDVFKALQMADNECAMGPGTGIGNVEMVSAFLRWKLGIGFVLDPVPEDGGLSLELAALVTRFNLSP